MGHFEAGQYVVSVHTDIEYLIVTVNWDSENQYVGERSDGERTPLRHEWVRPSTRAKKELRSENPLRRNIDYVLLKAEEVPVGAIIFYGAEGTTWSVTDKKTLRFGAIKFSLKPLMGKYEHGMPLILDPTNEVQVESVPDDEKPVTLQPLGDGKYRVNGMNRSAVTGRYTVKNDPDVPLLSQEETDKLLGTTYKYNVAQRIGGGDFVIDARRAQTGTGVPEYKIGEAWYYEGFVDKLAKEKPHYKYEVGQEFPSGYKITERSHIKTHNTNFYKVVWTDSGNGMSSMYSEDQVTRYLDTKSVPFVAKTLALVTNVGVTTKIRHEDQNWMVKDIHLLAGEHTNKVQFGLALADEDHYEYKSVTFDEYDKVKVIA